MLLSAADLSVTWQNHKTAGVRQDLWRWSTPCSNQGQLEVGISELCPFGFWVSPALEKSQPLWTASFSAQHPRNRKVSFPVFKWHFLYFTLCPLPLSLSPAPPRCLALSSLLPLIRYLYTLIRSTSPFSRLNVTNFISFSSHDKSSNLLLSLWLFAGLFPIHPCVLYTGKPQTGHSTP